MALVLPMYNSHPYFSLKNLGKKSEHYTQQSTVKVKRAGIGKEKARKTSRYNVGLTPMKRKKEEAWSRKNLDYYGVLREFQPGQ